MSGGRRYEKIKYLGAGRFATVFKARDLEEDRIVAVKKIKLGSIAKQQDGISRTAIREIKLLNELSHPNIIKLLDVFGIRSSISLVFEFMETNLEAIIKGIVLTPSHIKSYILMTLQGLEHLHRNFILHRDLKPDNLLINENGILKLADFGLARRFGSPNRFLTNKVVTRWYRSPELLFGAKKYATCIDMWAVGCILAELLLKRPIFPGESDLDQLDKIFQVLGTPNESDWPGVSTLPDYIKFKTCPGMSLNRIFIAADDDLLYLLSRLLALNPLKRSECTEVLQMPYFSNQPAPTFPENLPRIGLAGLSVNGDMQLNSATGAVAKKLF